ncbi:MAG TPA: hypothetical protein PKI66_03835 [Methanobacteriaceae archaeon]|nr:hypothetical protein [Methanobacteriaceae archaeon]
MKVRDNRISPITMVSPEDNRMTIVIGERLAKVDWLIMYPKRGRIKRPDMKI